MRYPHHTSNTNSRRSLTLHSFVLPEEIIEFKIPVNEAIVRCCHRKRSKPCGEIIAFGLNPWLIFWRRDRRDVARRSLHGRRADAVGHDTDASWHAVFQGPRPIAQIELRLALQYPPANRAVPRTRRMKCSQIGLNCFYASATVGYNRRRHRHALCASQSSRAISAEISASDRSALSAKRRKQRSPSFAEDIHEVGARPVELRWLWVMLPLCNNAFRNAALPPGVHCVINLEHGTQFHHTHYPSFFPAHQ